MRFFETYLQDLRAFARRPGAFFSGAGKKPRRAAALALLVGALLGAVPLLFSPWQERRLGEAAAGVNLALVHDISEAEKEMMKGVTPTVTRKTGLLGLGKKEESNPAFEKRKAEIARMAEEKRAAAGVQVKALRERARAARLRAWGAAGGASLALLLLLAPGIAAAGGAGEGRSRKRKGSPSAAAGGETVELSLPEGESAVGPEGRYLLREGIGRGTTGVVYRAWDRSLEREVAVKEMPKPLTADSEAYKRFRREALTLARLSHPGIVQVYDLFEKEGRAFLVMEFMGGGTLAQMVENEGRLDLHRGGGMAVTVFDALTYLHGQGVIHRDLKPGNILLSERQQPKLSDFGLARWDRQNDLTRDGALLGSPNYMSPEQVAGKKADRRSDLYAFGAFLYWLVTGTPPFQGEVEAVLAMHLTRLPSPPSSRNPKVPRQLDSLIMSLLAKDPADREQDVDKVRKALTALAGWK